MVSPSNPFFQSQCFNPKPSSCLVLISPEMHKRKDVDREFRDRTAVFNALFHIQPSFPCGRESGGGTTSKETSYIWASIGTFTTRCSPWATTKIFFGGKDVKTDIQKHGVKKCVQEQHTTQGRETISQRGEKSTLDCPVRYKGW